MHQASGWAALAYALILGKRTPPPGAPKAHHKPHNTTLVFLGTVLIWFGWFGFNGGSELSINIRALIACFNTNTAAAAGVLGWTLVDFIRTRGKFSVVGACSGAIAGLVGVTPAAGFVSIWIAALIGFLTAFIIAWLQNLNEWLHIDEGMEVFKLHGIGGILGSFFTVSIQLLHRIVFLTNLVRVSSLNNGFPCLMAWPTLLVVLTATACRLATNLPRSVLLLPTVSL